MSIPKTSALSNLDAFNWFATLRVQDPEKPEGIDSVAKVSRASSYIGQSRIARIINDYIEAEGAKEHPYIDELFPVDKRLSSKKPQEIFWGLKDKWWMQLIDGEHHKFGPLVYDEGLHGWVVEADYLSNAKKACLDAVKDLMDQITTSKYWGMHKTACSHWNNEAMNQFKTAALCKVKIAQLFTKSAPPNQKILDLLKENAYQIHPEDYDSDKNWELHCKKFGGEEVFKKRLRQDQRPFEKDIVPLLELEIEKMNKYIAQFTFKDGKPLAYFARHERLIFIYYQYSDYDSQTIESIVKQIFKDFHTQMAKATSRDDKIRTIARVFQVLEWLHPFPDGQGRTDLILLSKLLCQYGFNPAILKYPYVSTFSTLEGWVDYLKEGMEDWQSEFSRNQK